MRRVVGMVAACAAAMAVSASARAEVVTFDGFQGFTSLVSEGVRDSYQGYDWGFGLTGGVSQRQMWDAPWGWWISTPQAYYNPPPLGGDGSAFAWNGDGPQSLWIDFRGATDVLSVDLAFATSRPDEPSNAASVRLFAYDADDNLLFQSSAFALTNTFQTFDVSFQGVRYLEFRAPDDRDYFAVDNLVLGGVPEPATWAMMILGFGLMGMLLRRDVGRRTA